MELKARNPRLSQEYGVGLVLNLTLDLGSTANARKIIDDLGKKDLRVEVREWTEHRSLSANAYFHVLCGKIASVTKSGADEVKKALVLDYGKEATDKDGNIIVVHLPKDVDPEDMGIKYSRWVGNTQLYGKWMRSWMVYEETHRLDTKAFSRLVDGAVYEAKNLGIETMTPQDLARLEGYVQTDKSITNTDSGETKSA